MGLGQAEQHCNVYFDNPFSGVLNTNIDNSNPVQIGFDVS